MSDIKITEIKEAPKRRMRNRSEKALVALAKSESGVVVLSGFETLKEAVSATVCLREYVKRHGYHAEVMRRGVRVYVIDAERAEGQ